MLRQIRDKFRYLKWILLIVVAMFLWWVFVPGGSAPRTGGDGGWAARVNGRSIPVATFQEIARQLDGWYRSQWGDQYDQQLSSIPIGQLAINSLIDKELLYQQAVAQGIRVSPRELAESITRDPALQENGEFIGLERYERRFRGGAIGRADFEARRRRDLVIGKFQSLIGDGVDVLDEEVEAEFVQRNERLTVDYLVVDRSAAAGDITSDEAEITRYYDEHVDRYSRGEGRTGRYVLFNTREMANSQQVTDTEVRSAYDRARDPRFTRPQQRRASHILFRLGSEASPEEVARVEKAALAVLKPAREGEDFAALAREHSDDPSKENGGDLNFFGRG